MELRYSLLFQPADHGFLSWVYDPAQTVNTSALPVSGTLYGTTLKLPVGGTVTNVHVQVVGPGSGLTAGQCFAALYNGATLVGVTGDQSATWNSNGLKTMALTGGPFACAAGSDYRVAFFANGTTRPSFVNGVNNSTANANLAAANSRFFSADTGLTTSMPGTMATKAANNTAYWAAVS
jgi:hypothetical protein